LWLKKDSRRYFVVNIPHTQQTINAKLAEGGFKDRLLAALDPNGPGPSALKHYFEKEVIIENKKIFHDAAPRTNALEDLIDRSKSDAVRMMEECLQNETWPFANHMDREKDQFWGYSGLVNRDEFFNRIRASEQFKGLYFPLKDCEKFLKDNCIPWPNGEKTKQIILMDKAKRRVYLIKDYPIPLGQDDLGPSKLSEMTEGQLGSHYMHFQHLDLCSTQVRSIEEYYREKVLPPKPNINL